VGYYRTQFFCDDDEIGWRTTTQQPTNKRRHGARQRKVGGSLAVVRRWRQRGGGAQRDGVSAGVGSSKWFVGKFILVWYCWEFCADE